MEQIRKPGPRKQELISKFFWMRTFLLTAKRVGVDLRMNARQEKAVIETVWNAQNAYTQSDDDDYNFNIALEAYQMLENGLMEAGIDVEAGVRAAMKRNGYTTFNQMKPAPAPARFRTSREIPDDFFEIDQPKPAVVGSSDPWD